MKDLVTAGPVDLQIQNAHIKHAICGKKCPLLCIDLSLFFRIEISFVAYVLICLG